MRQPGSSQIIYVQVDADDTTEVYAAPAEKNVFVRVIDAFRSAFTDAINYFSWACRRISGGTAISGMVPPPDSYRIQSMGGE